MAVYKSLSSWVDKVKATNNKAAYRAINKSLAKANTQFKRVITKETGLKSKDVSKRLYTRKANSKSLTAFLSLGTKIGIPLDMFKPKVKIVKKGKGKKARKYSGVTVKIPAEGGRYLVPGAFLATVKSGKSLVLARKGKARNPVQSLRYNIDAAARQHQASLVSFLKDDFKTQYKNQIKALTT